MENAGLCNNAIIDPFDAMVGSEPTPTSKKARLCNNTKINSFDSVGAGSEPAHKASKTNWPSRVFVFRMAN
jgi:hypothetical protein